MSALRRRRERASAFRSSLLLRDLLTYSTTERNSHMAKIPAPSAHDHPIARFKAGGKPPKPPMPAKAKVRGKAKLRKSLKKRGK
jgi:hypothetical protein